MLPDPAAPLLAAALTPRANFSQLCVSRKHWSILRYSPGFPTSGVSGLSARANPRGPSCTAKADIEEWWPIIKELMIDAEWFAGRSHLIGDEGHRVHIGLDSGSKLFPVLAALPAACWRDRRP
jgi:hypothetical protein